MIPNRWQRMVAAVCAVTLLLSGCTTLHDVPVPSGETPPSLPQVKVGDDVVILTKTLQKKKFTVTAVEADALVGDGVRVAYADMATLGVKQVSKGATTVLLVTIGVCVYLAYATAHLFSDWGE